MPGPFDEETRNNIAIAELAWADRLSFYDSGGTLLVTFEPQWAQPSGGRITMSNLPLEAQGESNLPPDGREIATGRFWSSQSNQEIPDIPAGVQDAVFTVPNRIIQPGRDAKMDDFECFAPSKLA